jgi:hypothetical protein
MTRSAAIIHACGAGLVLSLAASPTAHAQPSSSVQPVTFSPGAIVLLASDKGPAAAETLRRALKSEDPLVRRAAARVASVSHPEVFDAVLAALRAEQDPAVRIELVKDAIALGDVRGLALVEPEARKDDARPMREVVEWFARVEPDQFAARLPVWAALPEHVRSGLAEMVVVAARRHPAAQDRILRAWLALAPAGEWHSVLRNMFRAADGNAARDALLRDALASDRPSVREDTTWFIARLLSLKGAVGTAPIDAALSQPPDSGAWTAFGRELIARIARKKKAEDFAEAVKREGLQHREDLYAAWMSKRLTNAERDAVGQLGGNFPPSGEDHHSATMRTPERLAAQLLESTMSAARCEPIEGQIVLARIGFAPDGRPMRVDFNDAGLTSGCRAALEATARISTADREDVAVDPQALAVPLSRAFASCAALVDGAPVEPAATLEQPLPDRQPPRLIKEVKPDYNQAGMRKRLEGIMVIEGVLTETGCVRSGRVVQSLQDLDIQGLKAILDWQFTPARVHEKPVPIIINIELTFKR